MKVSSRFTDYAPGASMAAGLLSSVVFAKYFPISTLTGLSSLAVLLVTGGILLLHGRTARLPSLIALMYLVALSFVLVLVWVKVVVLAT